MLSGIIIFFHSLVKNWSEAFKLKSFKLTLCVSIITGAPLFIFLSTYFKYLEQRSGCNLEDHLLIILPSFEVSGIIFLILYFSILFELIYIIRDPWMFLRACQVFILLHFTRIICLYLTPLDPPIGIIILQDPFLQNYFYSDYHPVTKDLFFSGHTATIFIFMLLNWKVPILRIVFGLLTLIMALLLMIQHCHYTVDIIAGAVFAYLSYRWVSWIWNKFQLN